MPRYKLTIEYDGVSLAGWQRVDGHMSVQQALEEATARLCGSECQIVGAGRTDAGVHALAQVAHVDLPKAYDPFTVMNALNFHLLECGEDVTTSRGVFRRRFVCISAAEEVPDDFHARFSAKSRHYLYRILARRAPSALDAERAWHVPDELDVHAMHDASQLLLGTHDFTSFRDSRCQAKSPIRTIDAISVARYGDEIQMRVTARSFLHHQVRIMAGTLKLAGMGKWSVSEVKNALAAKDRTAGGPTAPAHGLYLVGVDY